MTIIYFSATGNSLYIAKHLSEKLYSIPQLRKQAVSLIQDHKAIGLVLPVYAQIIAPFFEEFLLTTTLQTPYLFAILTHGKALGMAGEHLQHILKQRGLHLSYFNSIEMVDNYLPMFSMQEQIAQTSNEVIAMQISQISEEIRSKTHYIKSSPLPFTQMEPDCNPPLCQNFTIENHCTGCSTCLKVCPLANIHMHQKRPQFGANCINCLACTHNCPENAIRLQGELSKDRYRKAEITLNDIISSNIQ